MDPLQASRTGPWPELGDDESAAPLPAARPAGPAIVPGPAAAPPARTPPPVTVVQDRPPAWPATATAVLVHEVRRQAGTQPPARPPKVPVGRFGVRTYSPFGNR